jgi:hypothetical protein
MKFTGFDMFLVFLFGAATSFWALLLLLLQLECSCHLFIP